MVDGALVVTRPPQGEQPAMHVAIQPLDEYWMAAYYIDTIDGTPTIVEVRIVPTGDRGAADDRALNLFNHEPFARPERPLMARSLQRQLKPGQAIRQLRSMQATLDDERLQAMGLTREVLADQPDRPARAKLPDHFIAALAMEYVKSLERGSNRPIEDVTATLNAARGSRHHATYVRDLIARARREAFLGPRKPGRGKPQGWPTPKCRAALENAPQAPLA